jgi:hypothetical protein
MRLVDFQLNAFPPAFAGLSEDVAKGVNGACFPVYESLRLWLKDRKVEAPFRKIVIDIRDASKHADWHGRAFSALGVCRVNEAVDPVVLRAHAQDTEWLASLVLDGLDHIEAETGWANEELRMCAALTARSHPPCAHRFEQTRKRYKGTVCDTWFEADVGYSVVKARFTLPSGETRDVVLAEEAGPISLQREYYVKSAVVLDGHYVIREPDKWELARVPIPIA